MAVLKNPQSQIPGGFKFYEAATKWSPTPFSSLDSITQQLIAHRSGRPDLTQKLGWPLDKDAVYQEVTAYNVALCVRMGWNDYILGSAETVPFRVSSGRRNPLEKLRGVLGGAETLISWIADGAPTAPQEVANRRAEICAVCPMNGQDGWETYFTVPASNAIRRELERRKRMKLETPLDDKLGTCIGCDCPLPLKIHLPLAVILEKMPEAQKAALHPDCWITHEKP